MFLSIKRRGGRLSCEWILAERTIFEICKGKDRLVDG
jgi:hypothetical protein